MTDLLALLLGQVSKEPEETRAEELNAALQTQAALTHNQASARAGESEGIETNPSPALQLDEEYSALRRTASGLHREAGNRSVSVGPQVSQVGSLSRPGREIFREESGQFPDQRLIIKEIETGSVLAPADLDRLFERDARRYDNGFTLY